MYRRLYENKLHPQRRNQKCYELCLNQLYTHVHIAMILYKNVWNLLCYVWRYCKTVAVVRNTGCTKNDTCALLPVDARMIVQKNFKNWSSDEYFQTPLSVPSLEVAFGDILASMWCPKIPLIHNISISRICRFLATCWYLTHACSSWDITAFCVTFLKVHYLIMCLKVTITSITTTTTTKKNNRNKSKKNNRSGMELLKTSQTRCKWRHNSFTTHPYIVCHFANYMPCVCWGLWKAVEWVVLDV